MSKISVFKIRKKMHATDAFNQFKNKNALLDGFLFTEIFIFFVNSEHNVFKQLQTKTKKTDKC